LHVGAVCKSGLSCHQAAAQFGVGISTAILWVQRFRETGSVEPDQTSGCKRAKWRKMAQIRWKAKYRFA
jgi:putative transposase